MLQLSSSLAPLQCLLPFVTHCGRYASPCLLTTLSSASIRICVRCLCIVPLSST